MHTKNMKFLKLTIRLALALIIQEYGFISNTVHASDVNMKSLFIRADTVSRYSQVSIQSEVYNLANTSKEMNFQVQLPEEAFITQFSMKTENGTWFGIIKEKDEAEKDYNEAKEKGQTGAQVKLSNRKPDRNMKFFSVVLNVKRESQAIFELKYEELLKRELGYYTQRIHIEPQQVVDNVTVMATYKDDVNIDKFVYSVPVTGNKSLVFHTDSSNDVQLLAGVDSRTLLFTPSVKAQGTSGIQGDIVIKYDIERRQDGGIIQIQDNAFVHHFAPSGLSVMDKNIVFVIDVSGSMSGNKIKEVRLAMEAILKRLRENDVFNIILFASSIRKWRESPVFAKRENVHKALEYCKAELVAGGGTNIYIGLKAGISTLNNFIRPVGESGSMVVFLTDGMPTSGITDLSQIIDMTKKQNTDKCSLYCLGFGEDVDFKFLKRLALSNHGRAFRIYDDKEQDGNKQLEEFFRTIETVQLSNVVFEYPQEIIDLDSITNSNFQYYYNGSELIVSGLLKYSIDAAEFAEYDILVHGNNQDGSVSFDVTIDQKDRLSSAPKGYIKRLWAYMKIKELLDKALVYTGIESMESYYKEKALNMSLKYGFVTPLTSMVVTSQVHALNPGLDSSMELMSSYARFPMKDVRVKSQNRNAAISPNVHFQGTGSQYPGKSSVNQSTDMHFVILFCCAIKYLFEYGSYMRF